MDKGLELRRKLFHIGFGLVIVILLYLNLLNLARLIIVLAIGFVVSLVSKYKKIPIINWFLEKHCRENEITPGAGPLTFVLGVLLVLILFDKEIALASILILTLGDSLNAIIYAIYQGHDQETQKLAFGIGLIITILICSLAARFFVSTGLAFLGSIAGITLELLGSRYKIIRIEDNILIPLVSGIVIYLVPILL